MKEDKSDLNLSNKINHLIKCFKLQINSNDSGTQGQRIHLKRLSLSLEILEYFNTLIAKKQEDSVLVKDILNKSFHLELHSANSTTVYGNIDLKNFESLLSLELNKLPFKNIRELRKLAPFLLTLICNNVQLELQEFLNTPNNEKIGLFSLKTLKLSNCNLKDVSFSEFILPNLEILDLSRNYIDQTLNIQRLNSIQVLNLGYNKISALTFLPKGSISYLTNLYLPFNFLSNLEGIEKLENLAELDICNNFIADIESLQSLSKLRHLKVLNMQNNPLCSQKNYFQVLKTLHKDSIINGFMLDGQVVSKKDKQRLEKMCPTDSPRAEVAEEAILSFSRPPQDQNLLLEQRVTASSPHLKKRFPHTQDTLAGQEPNDAINMGASTSKNVAPTTTSLDSNTPDAVPITDDLVPKPLVKLKEGRKKNIKKTIVPQIITFPEEDGNISPIENNTSQKSQSSSLAESPSYQVYQKEIERLRAAHGPSWLLSSSLKTSTVSVLRDMGTKNNALKKPKEETLDTSDSSVSNKKLSLHRRTSSEPRFIYNADAPADNSYVSRALKENDKATGLSSSCKQSYLQSPYVAPSIIKETLVVSETIEKEEPLKRKVSELSEGIEVLSQIPSQDEDIFSHLEPFEADDEDTEETLSDDNVFFASRDDYEDPIILIFRDSILVEKNALNNKKLESLDLRNLLSATEIPVSDNSPVKGDESDQHLLKNSVSLKLKFDSVKRSKKQRLYFFQTMPSFEAFMDKIKPFLDIKAQKELEKAGAMQCLKCYAQFPRNSALKRFSSVTDLQTQLQNNPDVKPQEACPACKSFLIIQLDKDAKPSPLKKPKDSFLNSSTVETASSSYGSGITTLSGDSIIPWTMPEKEIIPTIVPEPNMSSSYLWGHLSAPQPITWDFFIKTLDHNGKVFLEFQLFSDKEEMLAAIKCTISSKTEHGPGWLVLSTQKMYIFHGPVVTQKSLKTSEPLQEFVSFYLLHSHQGFVFATSKISHTFIIADSMITLEFVCYLKGLIEQKALHVPKLTLKLDNPKPDVPSILQQWSDVLEMTELGEVTSLLYFDWDSVIFTNQPIGWKPIALVITDEYLLVTLYVEEQLFPKPLGFQAISNLVCIHVFPSLLQLGLHFYDENNRDRPEKVWLLKCSTLPSIKTLLKTLKPIWENIYSQPLELKTTRDCEHCSTIIDDDL